MGDSSSQQPQTQTTTTEPWGVSKPYLSEAMKEAAYLYKNDLGYKPWTGATQAALDPASTDALNMSEQMARAGGPLTGATYNSLTDMMGQGGLSAEARAAMSPLQQTASGQYLGQVNPYLQGTLDAQSAKIRNAVNSSMSGGGRYGSGAHTDVLTRSLADATMPILAQNYENERTRQLSAAQGMVDTYTGGLDRSLRGAALAPAVDDMRFSDASRLAGIGDFRTGREQDALNSLIQTWNQAEARPWDQLGRFNAIATGVGQLGGTGTVTKPYSGPSTAQTAIGGAVAGAGIGSTFGPWGALAGAAGGGLLGLLA